MKALEHFTKIEGDLLYSSVDASNSFNDLDERLDDCTKQIISLKKEYDDIGPKLNVINQKVDTFVVSEKDLVLEKTKKFKKLLILSKLL
jgi:tetrahydromethanopterin S-methyltransferase subunit G